MPFTKDKKIGTRYKEMKLFVDDLRKPPEGWELARTNTDAIKVLSMGLVEEISLDHDIIFTTQEESVIVGHYSEETFQPIAYYIARMEKKPKVLFHTANIEAGRDMADTIGCQFDYWWIE